MRVQASTTATEASPLSDEEMKKLSAFRDFINSLDLDDLGENKAD